MSWAAVAILAFVTLQRLGELWLSNRNRRWLIARGGREVGSAHYPALVAVHVLWLAALWWLAWDTPPDLVLLALFVLLQVGRLWVIASLGRRWTTRIIVLPNTPLVRSGPFRFFDHPNYIVVALEIAVLPLVFGLIAVALLFTLLNAAVLAVRIRCENKALALARTSP